MNIKRLNTQDSNFWQELEQILAWETVSDRQVNNTVEEIITQVRQRGDDALVEYTNRFDRMQVGSMAELIISKERLHQALQNIPQEQREALEQAAQRVRAYHEHQKQESWT
ncbi:MAG: histidinol dehydrogenase, partial [Gammaproteobacteria bacterium SG8_11]